MKVALVHRFFWRQGAVPAVVSEWADHLTAAGRGHRFTEPGPLIDATVITAGLTVENTLHAERGKQFTLDR